MAGAFAKCWRAHSPVCCRALAGLMLALLVAMPTYASAQRPLVGVVTDRETSAPLSGVYVALEDRAQGRAVAAALTDESGRFLLAAAVGGTYRLRAERVGLGTEVTEWFIFEDGAAPHRIAMTERAVELEGLDVQVPVRTCRLVPAEATLVQRWWDEVRKALEATAFGEAADVAELRFERYEREWSSNLRALRVERELPMDSTPSRPFTSQNAETLSERGFVQGEEGRRLFLAPDAAVLFSGAFLSDHCLRIARRDDEIEGVGEPGIGELRLAVRPTRERPPDIRGVLTVDTVSGELRSFDFAYVNLPPDLPPSRAGGHLTFAYLPSGAWVVSDWWIRLPRVEYRWGEGSRRGSVPLVQGYVDQGGRAVGEGGRALETRLGRGTVHGFVYDSIGGRALAGARVSVVGTRYATRAGPDGRFTLAGIPAGRRGLTFHHAALTSLGLPSPVVSVEMTEGASDTVALAVPGFATVAELLCPSLRSLPEAILTGKVLDERRAERDGSAEIRARWIDGGDRSMRSEARAGSDGRYTLCDVPAGVPIDLAVRTESTSWRQGGTVELARGGVSVMELRPGAEARALVRGTVRDADRAVPLAGADVWVLAVTGDTVSGAQVDSTGHFRMSVPPGVGYRAVASVDGYLREASTTFTLEGAESLHVTFELIEDPGRQAMKIEGIKVEIEARNRTVARRLLRQYGQSEASMGRRWIGVATLDSIPPTGEYDPGVAISRQGMPGVWVDQAAKRGQNPILCVQQRPHRCSIVILNGMRIDLSTALQVDFQNLEGIAVLSPEDATTFFGTEGGGGAVLLWMRGSGR